MTWDSKFDGVDDYLNMLSTKGRNLVVIIDPHIKIDNSYFIYNDAIANGNNL
jgi:alpha 1,3-glucosidase